MTKPSTQQSLGYDSNAGSSLRTRVTSTSGFSLVIVVVAVVVLSIAGFAAWRLWDSNKDQSGHGVTVEPSDLPAPDPNPNSQPPQTTDPNEGYVVIKEWGVRFKPVEGLEGVEYFVPKGIESDGVSITTNELARIEPNCSSTADRIVLGLLTRSKSPQSESGGVIATISEHTFQYRAAQAACSENPSNLSLESKVGNLIVQSIRSLEKVK